MKTIILYMSKHGTTKKVAEMLSDLLLSDVILIDLRKDPDPDISEADMIVIGGSIHMGTMQNRIRKYCTRNMDKLLSLPLGLYVCCMEKEDTAQLQFAKAFPKRLREHAKSISLPGGEILAEDMNFIEKSMVKKVVPNNWSQHCLDHELVSLFAKQLQD